MAAKPRFYAVDQRNKDAVVTLWAVDPREDSYAVQAEARFGPWYDGAVWTPYAPRFTLTEWVAAVELIRWAHRATTTPDQEPVTLRALILALLDSHAVELTRTYNGLQTAALVRVELELA